MLLVRQFHHSFKHNPLEDGVPNAYFGKSENGWMNTSLFYGWLGNHFAQRIPPSRPVVLVVDGHGSHIDIELSKLAIQNQINLYCLPPNCTHCLQPCDVSFFKPLKSNWDVAVEEWEANHLGEVLNKYEFAGVFRKAWERTIKVSTLVNSFRGTGLCPLDRSAIKDCVIAPSTVHSKATPVNNGGTEGTDDEEEKTGSEVKKDGSEVEHDSSSVVSSNEVVGECSESKEGDEAKDVVDECEISLQELEKSMSVSQIERFNLRLEDGYNLGIDPLYLQWKRAKLATSGAKASSSQVDVEALTGDQSVALSPSSAGQPSPAAEKTPSRGIQPTKKVSPILEDILIYPEQKSKKGKAKAHKEQTPSHLTSEQFIKLCEEKEKRKQEEEELKAKNKLEREEKALQRKKDQEKKAEERRKKKEERARKKEEEDKRKEERRIERERKRQEKEMRNPRKRLYSGATDDQGTSASAGNLIGDEGPSTSGTSTSEPRPKRAVSENVPWCGFCGT